MNTSLDKLTVESTLGDILSVIGNYDDGILKNASYETGLLGYALYYSYLAKLTGESAHTAKAHDYVDRAIEALDLKNFRRIYDTDSLDGHLSHIGRFLVFVEQQHLLEIDSAAYLDQLDEILFDLMKSKITIKDFDSLSGAMASGYYFLARKKSGVNVDTQLAYLVSSLDNFAEKDKQGDYFWKSPSLYNRVYLGISHGSSLVIAFLSQVCELGIEKDRCKTVIRKAVNFLKKHYRVSPYKGLFPNMVGDKIEPMQFAMCYGDIGNGYALFKAGVVLEDTAISDFANLVLDDCLLRSKEDNLTLDASIFYGASGLVISFRKMYDLTGDQRYLSRSNYWYEQILTYRIHENAYAGFRSRLDESELWNVSFGWGLLGIGLTLMAYSDRQLPTFDSLTFVA